MMRPLIYTPSGRAGEYANHGYAANLYSGCTHGCKYCYVPGVLRKTPDSFHSKVETVPEMARRLTQDMKRVGILPEPIFLCFACDPYCADAPEGMTRAAIKTIIESGNAVNILTKGGALATRDFDLLAGTKSLVGATLTFWDENLSLEWEPKAALPKSRIMMLFEAKMAGLQTWASIEPVIIPEQSLKIMRMAAPFVDTFKIGKWNHDKRSNEIDWGVFLRGAVALCERLGKHYVIKEDLLKWEGK
jgi:DNA repair photolyase